MREVVADHPIPDRLPLLSVLCGDHAAAPIMNEPIPITARQGMWGTVGTEVPTEHSTAHAVVRPRCAPLVRCDFPAIAVTKRFQRQRGRSRGWAERRKLRRQLVRLRLRNHAHLAERFPNLTERPGAARRCSSDGPVLQSPEHGPMRVYQFGRGESREVTEGVLVRQLGSAGIAVTPNPSFNPQANSTRK